MALERSVRGGLSSRHLSRSDTAIPVDHTRPNGNAYQSQHPMGHAVEDTSANTSKDARLRLRSSMISEGGIDGT